MCLVSSDLPKPATTNIKCYKVVILNKDKNTHQAPFNRHITYNTWPNLIPNEDAPCPERYVSIAKRIFYSYTEGYIHAFTCQNRAINLTHWLASTFTTTEVWECIIPKDTLYVRGPEDSHEICARKIIADRRIYRGDYDKLCA